MELCLCVLSLACRLMPTKRRTGALRRTEGGQQASGEGGTVDGRLKRERDGAIFAARTRGRRPRGVGPLHTQRLRNTEQPSCVMSM